MRSGRKFQRAIESWRSTRRSESPIAALIRALLFDGSPLAEVTLLWGGALLGTSRRSRTTQRPLLDIITSATKRAAVLLRRRHTPPHLHSSIADTRDHVSPNRIAPRAGRPGGAAAALPPHNGLGRREPEGRPGA